MYIYSGYHLLTQMAIFSEYSDGKTQTANTRMANTQTAILERDIPSRKVEKKFMVEKTRQ